MSGKLSKFVNNYSRWQEPYKYTTRGRDGAFGKEDHRNEQTRVVPLRIPEHLDELASLSAREEHTDKVTALRQWLHKGAALYVLNLVADGRVSKGRAAEMLDVSIYDILNLAQTYGIELGPTDEQMRQSRELVDKLWPKRSE